MTSIFPHFVLYYTLHLWFRIYKKRFFRVGWCLVCRTCRCHHTPAWLFNFVLANQRRDLRIFAYHFQGRRKVWKSIIFPPPLLVEIGLSDLPKSGLAMVTSSNDTKVCFDSYQTQIRQLKMQPNLWIDSRVEGNSLIAYDKIEWCYVTIKRTSLKYKLFYFKNHNKKLCLSFNTLAALHQCTQ